MTVGPGRMGYRQIADDLRSKLAAGVYSVGSVLPSTAKLAQEYAVSATVIQRAIGELKHEGLVEGQPGKAVYVRAEPKPPPPSAEYTEIMGKLDALEQTMGKAITDLNERMSRLEQAGPELGTAE